jgi:YgiT-type zinc finger domain-containing protein
MKKYSKVNKIFKGKYILSDVTMYVCEKCGEEYISDEEYERIRKKIEEIESKSRIPAVHEVIAKARFIVL